VHGLYKSYTGLEARVESRSDNHRPSRLGHVGAHDGRRFDLRHVFFVTDRQKRDYWSRASQRARDAAKNGEHRSSNIGVKVGWEVKIVHRLDHNLTIVLYLALWRSKMDCNVAISISAG